MKKAISYIILAAALVLGTTACNHEIDGPGNEMAGPVKLVASIADERTKATLDDDSGAFVFSATDPKDTIKVYNGTGVYSSINVSVDGSSKATFTMGEGFENTGSGFAAFPARIVSTITDGGVTFNLPDTYSYAQVGSGDASSSRVPCPMMATFTAGSELSFKQVGAVIRFRVKECLDGTLTFTFKTPVTGTVTLSSVPSGTDDGILATNLTSPGYSITVTGVPEVTGDNCFYITLPVPTRTDPMNVGVSNHKEFGEKLNKVARLSGTISALNRAGGRKRGVNLVNVMSGVKYNNLFLDGYLYYDGSKYSVDPDPLGILSKYNTDYQLNKSYFTWRFLKDAGFCEEAGVSICTLCICYCFRFGV